MSLLAVLFWASGGALAVAAIWLVVVTRQKERAALAALADHHGWNHQPTAPQDLLLLAKRVLPQETAAPLQGRDLLDYFAGATRVGPFRLTRVRLSPRAGPPTHREATLVHIRTPLCSPGVNGRPSTRFHPAGSSQHAAAQQGDRFSRLYQATGTDPEFTERALDPETRAFIAAPRRTIRFDWQERDLVIAFPFAARTPRAVEALVDWSAVLARRLNEGEHPERGRAAGRTSPTSTPAARGAATGRPAAPGPS